MNTTINEIYALISILLIVITLLFGLSLWLASKAANTIFNTLNNKINTLENITFERLMLIEEQNKKINEMDETIISLIEQNKLFDKIHYNIVYDINNIEKTITTLLDDTSTQIKKLLDSDPTKPRPSKIPNNWSIESLNSRGNLCRKDLLRFLSIFHSFFSEIFIY